MTNHTQVTPLIPVFSGEISGSTVQLVNARLLHSFLESAQDFSDWIKNRIKEYGFIENIDFLLHKFREQKGRGGHNKIDYHLTIDMAKELGMIERTGKGRQIRRYFLEMERQAKQAHQEQSAMMLQRLEEIFSRYQTPISVWGPYQGRISCLTASELFKVETKNRPLSLLLKHLKEDGCVIDGADAEYQAMNNLLKVYQKEIDALKLMLNRPLLCAEFFGGYAV